MNNYLVLISRSDFINLYKYGHFYVHNAVPFNGDMDSVKEDKALFDAVTNYMDTFEYSMEYLILHFRKKPYIGSTIEVFIRDIDTVFAIDESAKRTLEPSLDPRIYLQISDWGKFFEDKMKDQRVRQSIAGKYNCYEIFNIPPEDRSFVDKIFNYDFIKGVYDEAFKGLRPSGNKSIWHYLIRYERHSYYLNDLRGYLSDAIHVYENFKNKDEIGSAIADKVPAAQFIEETSDNDFIKILLNFDKAYGSQYIIEGCNYLIIASIFLLMFSTFKDGGINPIVIIENRKTYEKFYCKFGLDFSIAVALLGIKLGQDLTYSCYYQVKGLGIFQEPKKKEKDSGFFDPRNGEPIKSEDIQYYLERFNDKVNELSEENKYLEQKILDLNKREGSNLRNTNVDFVSSIDTKSYKIRQEKNKLSLENSDNIPEKNEGEGAEDIPQKSMVSETVRDNYCIENEKLQKEYMTESSVNTVSENEKFYNRAIESSIQGVDDEDSFRSVLMKEFKKTSNYTEPKIHGKEIYAHNQEEYDELFSKGFRIYNPTVNH